MRESNYDGVSVMELHKCSVRLLCVRFAVCESFGVKFAVCGCCSVWMLQCVDVAVCEGCSIWKLLCLGVVVCKSCGVLKLLSVGVAVYES